MKFQIHKRQDDGAIVSMFQDGVPDWVTLARDGWVDARVKCVTAERYAKALANPRLPKADLDALIDEPGPAPEPGPSEDADPRDALIAQGDELGLKLDRRMKPDTMRHEIAAKGAEPVA